jgi:hypothetical protein
MNATMLFRQITIVAFFVICITSADAIDASDYTRFSNLGKKLLQLRRDITNVQRTQTGGQGFECLKDLYNNLEVVSEQIDKLRVMVIIALSMNDKADKQTVVQMLNDEAGDVLQYLDEDRRAINSTAGYCSWNNVAVAKAQEILSLYSESTTLVRSVMKAR